MAAFCRLRPRLRGRDSPVSRGSVTELSFPVSAPRQGGIGRFLFRAFFVKMVCIVCPPPMVRIVCHPRPSVPSPSPSVSWFISRVVSTLGSTFLKGRVVILSSFFFGSTLFFLAFVVVAVGRCRQSWWVYESRAYTGSNMLSRITEAALATMVLAVVNQHHLRLHTPLQVRVAEALSFDFHSPPSFRWWYSFLVSVALFLLFALWVVYTYVEGKNASFTRRRQNPLFVK